MERFRIVQVSDTHLSRRRAYFVDNWEVFLALMAEDPPDLVVCTGDVAFHGPKEPDDLAFARALLDRLAVPWIAIPGNHDIGELPPDEKLGAPITKERLGRYLGHFGGDRWSRDLGAWRLMGLNAMLFGSDLDRDQAQRAWLERTLEERDGRPVALFVHKPLFLGDPDEEERGAACLPPQARRYLIALSERHDVRLYASGHIHLYREARLGGMRLISAPPTSYVNGRPAPERRIGTHHVGYVEYVLDGDELSHRFVEPPLFINHDIGNWMNTEGSIAFLPERPLGAAAGEG